MFIPKEIKVRIRHERTRYNETTRRLEPIDKNDPGPHLGYATYCDEKGKLRKEVSWRGWGDTDLGDFKNIPKKGFKLEKTVNRSRDWFGSGKTMFRVIHPDNFIFEISANNLNEIILSCNLNKGDIDDECILAWDGLNLALIPCSTESYKIHSKATERIENGALKPSDLIIGKAYQERNGQCVGYYVGRFYSLTCEFVEYDKLGQCLTDMNYYDRRNLNKHSTTVIFKPKQEYFFKDEGRYYRTWATPKLYECDKKSKVIEKGFIPVRDNYYDPIIPDDLVKRKNKDEILKWAEENANIVRRLCGIETVMKFEVKF